MTKLFFFILFFSQSILLFSCDDAAMGDVKVKSYEERYKEIEASIRNNPEWLATEEKKAKEKNITLDSLLKTDVPWVIDDQDGKHNKPYAQRMKEMEGSIRNNPAMLNAVTQKAKERNIPLDSMIKLDAAWMIDDQDGKHK